MDDDDDDEPMFGAGLRKATDTGNKYQQPTKKMPNFLDDDEDEEEDFIPKVKATPAASVATLKMNA